MRATAAKDARAKVPRAARGAALWVTVGFALGAISSHAASFSAANSEAVAADVAMSDVQIETGSLPVIHRIDPAHCVSLELDHDGNTTAHPCSREGLALRLEPSSKTRENVTFLADGSAR